MKLKKMIKNMGRMVKKSDERHVKHSITKFRKISVPMLPFRAQISCFRVSGYEIVIARFYSGQLCVQFIRISVV